jgi:Family of unknown function (DUF5984)
MFSFRFELCPLDEVSPWGGARPRLHWFGLTEGWYWIDANGYELLRRSRVEHPLPYIDYYLARLWEDVITLTPYAMESVPDDLRSFIASSPAAWARDPSDFVATSASDGVETVNAGSREHPVLAAAIWHGEHQLDLGYLRNAPRLRFWRMAGGDSDEVIVDWQHEDDGEIGFTGGQTFKFSVPTTEYLDAVRRLDRELLDAMTQRIEEVSRRGGLSGVDLDLVELQREHEDRRTWLSHNLDRQMTTNWDAVREGARLLHGEM